MGYIVEYSYVEKLVLTFRKARWIFSSVFFVEFVLNLVNWLVSNMSKHFFKYTVLSISVTPLPLSCFIMTILPFFDNFPTIFLDNL